MRVGGRRASACVWRRLLVGASLALSALGTSACARMGDLTGPTPIGGTVVSLELTNSAVTMSVGATVTLQAAGRDRENRQILDRPVTWSSSDSTVVRVSPSGVLTALATGSAQIAASMAGRSAVAQVTVIARPVASIEIGPLAPRVHVGGFVQLMAIPRDETGAALTNRVVLWSSSDATIANVDATGFLSGLSAGAATITARSETRETAVGVVVSAIPVASVVVTPRVDTIVVGQTTQLTASPRDSLTVPLPGRAITWRSSSNAVATVSASGLVVAVSPGTATISAEADNVSGSAAVVVRPRPIGAVIVSPAQATLALGESTALTVQVTDQNGNLLTGRAITYTSESATIAQVSTDGVVRGVGVGSTRIRVTSEGQTGIMSVTVVPTPVAAVRIEPATVALSIGGSATMSASALDAGGNVLPQRTVLWTSGAPSVFSVNADGVVRALTAGAGLVFAVIDGRLASASVTVSAVPVSVVQVSPPAAGLVIGNTFNLTATARDASGAILARPVQWTSSNPQAVVVSGTGTVRALSLGSARIDAIVDGVTGSAVITVSPVPVANVRVTLTDSSLTVGQTAQAVAVLRSASDSILTGRVVVWTSSAPSVATVSSLGVVTAVAGGSANITATSEGISASVAITVSQVVGSLVLQTQPAGAVSGSAFTTQPVVRILDAQGNLVTTGPGATLTVTAAKASGGATLSGTLTVNAVGGIAVFTNLAFTGTGTGAHTIRFSTVSPNLSVTSANVNVAVGPAAIIAAASTQSQSAAVLTNVVAPPSVRVTDAGGNPVSGRAVVFTVTAGLGTTTPASGTPVNTNASGIASLTQWRLGALPGLNRVLATSSGLTGSPVTFDATATIGAPTQLGLTTQPAGAVSGRVLTTQPVVEVRDVAGNRVAGATSAVTVTISSGNGTMLGTSTVNAVNGIATFTNLRVDGSGAHQLRFSASGLTAATSSTFTVTQVANALLVHTQPAGARSGVAFTTQPVVRILDDAGLLVTTGAGATLGVTATVASGVGQLSGAVAVNAVGGVATFTNLSLSGIGPHTLRFSTIAPALNVVSATVLVEPGLPDSLQPLSTLTQSAPVLTAVSAPPSVRVRDANGNAVPGVDVTFAVTAGGGVIVPSSGSTVTTDASGVATLTSWTVGAALGTNTVTAAVAGLKGSPVTFTATATVGPPAHITIGTQPSGAVSGVALTTQPVVEVRDVGGNLVTTANTAVTVSVASGNGTVGGTITMNAVNGIVTFTDLVVNGSGVHTLRFSASGLTAAVSASFTVTQIAASLVVQTQPAGAASGEPFVTQPVVRIRDNAGLLVTTGPGAALAVSAAINTGTGTLAGVTTVNAVNGIATFTNLSITGGGAHTLTFTTDAPALSVTSTSFIVGAGVPTTILADSDVSQSATVGTAVSDPPGVRVTDAGGNPVSGVSVTFAVTLGNGTTDPVSGSTVETNASGIARLTRWTLGTAAGMNAVRAVADGLNGSPVTFSATGTPGGASALAIVTQPAGAVSGVALTTQPVVEIQDSAGNRVTTATDEVTAEIANGTGALSGTVSVTAVDGVATFTNLAITGNGAHRLRFRTASPALAVTSSSFVVGDAVPAQTQLALTTQPGGAVSGVVLTTQPVIEVRDVNGLRVTTATDAVTAAIATGSGALLGTQTVSAVNGVATFTDLRVNGAGDHTLSFTASGLTATTSDTIVVTQVAASLDISTQPAGAVSGAAFTAQPVVRILDNAGLLIANGPAATLTLTAAKSSGAATLDGTLSVQAVGGVTTFADLAFTKTGLGAHTIEFSTDAPALTVTSDTLLVIAAAADSIEAASAQTQNAPVGIAVAAPPSVRVLDVNGNPVAGVKVAFAVTLGGGAIVPVATDTLLTNASGMATLTSWTVGAAAGENTVTATAVGLAGSPVTFTATATAPPDEPAMYVWFTQPRRAEFAPRARIAASALGRVRHVVAPARTER